jgi:LysM repeat protein
MKLAQLFLLVLLAMSCVGLGGCFPTSSSQGDEEKEPHFLEGKSRLQAMDYAGAIESFQRALEADPRSAAAHFELGWLYDQRETDPATAIYHYQSYLKLHPEGEQAERAKSRISACKQELARTIALAPVTQGLQHDFDQLTEENKRLKEEVERWRAFYTAHNAAQSNSVQTAARPAQPVVLVAVNPNASQSGGASSAHGGGGSTSSGSAAPVAARTYTVKNGDTPAAIARKYGVKVDALMAANPRVDARRLQIGQSLTIPAP